MAAENNQTTMIVTDKMLKNLISINQRLVEILPRISDGAMVISSPKGRLWIDRDMGMYVFLKNIADSKNEIGKKIEHLYNSALKWNAATPEAKLIRERIIGIKEKSRLQEEELRFLREELLANIKGKSELFFIHFLSMPASQIVEEVVSREKNSKSHLTRLISSLSWKEKTVFDYLKFRLESYRESNLLKEIKYLLHIISRREIEFLESVKKEGNIRRFYLNPAQFIENIKRTVLRENMTKDIEFMKKLEMLKNKAEQIPIDYISFLNNAPKELARIMPSPEESGRGYTFSEMEQLIGKVKAFLKIFSDKYKDRRILKQIIGNNRIKHFLRYIYEIRELLNILKIIPGADKYVENIPPDLRGLIDQSREYLKEWNLFEEFYNNLKEDGRTSSIVRKFGDVETYNLFLRIKEQFHMWPKKWAEEISKRILEISSSQAVTEIVRDTKKELERIIEIRRKEMLLELKKLSDELRITVDKKIRKLAEESERAFGEIERLVEKRIRELSRPEKEKIRKVSAFLNEAITERENYWVNLSEEVRKAGENIQRMMDSYERMYDNLMATIPKPEAIAYKIEKKSQEKINVLRDVYHALNWLEKAQMNSVPHIDEISWLKSIVPRLNRADDAHKFQQGAYQELKRAFGKKGFEVFNRVYILGWQALKEAYLVQNVLKRAGVYQVLDEIKRRNMEIEEILGATGKKEKESAEKETGATPDSEGIQDKEEPANMAA